MMNIVIKKSIEQPNLHLYNRKWSHPCLTITSKERIIGGAAFIILNDKLCHANIRRTR
jgi:hypothetical protein